MGFYEDLNSEFENNYGFTSGGKSSSQDSKNFDLSDFISKIKHFFPDIERDEIYPKALKKAADYLRDEVEAATPIRWTNLTEPVTKYKTRGHKLWRPPGQAKHNVIVYKRKNKQSFYQQEVNVNISYLIGYEKSKAYYMYWREYGNKFQPARPVIRPVFDSCLEEAIAIAVDFIAADHEKRLGG